MTGEVGHDLALDPVRLSETFDSLREGIQILSPEWRYLYVNSAVAAHGRLTPEQLLGRTMLECYPGIEKTEMFAVLERCMRDRASASIENEFEYPSGEHAWFELRIHPCREGLIVLSLDVTERKRLEAALRQAHKLKALGQMAAGVAHDLKNILNPIGLWLSVLERKLEGQPELAENLKLMRASLKRGDETIKTLRDFARQVPVATSSELVEVDKIAKEAIQLCMARAAQQTRIVIADELGAPPPVRANASELLAAVVNVVLNAIDAMPEGGRVTLRSGASPEGSWLEVHDTGMGMSPEVQRRAFEPFFTTKGEAGTGLGLAMVYAFVARHHGEIRLRSTPAEGTSVTLSFPAA